MTVHHLGHHMAGLLVGACAYAASLLAGAAAWASLEGRGNPAPRRLLRALARRASAAPARAAAALPWRRSRGADVDAAGGDRPT